MSWDYEYLIGKLVSSYDLQYFLRLWQHLKCNMGEWKGPYLLIIIDFKYCNKNLYSLYILKHMITTFRKRLITCAVHFGVFLVQLRYIYTIMYTYWISSNMLICLMNVIKENAILTIWKKQSICKLIYINYIDQISLCCMWPGR